jgi:glutamyl-tRNA reductase
MKLWLTGLNHKTAPVEVRERLAFPEGDLPRALQDLTHRPGLQEGLILSTCNRVEVAVTSEDTVDAPDEVERFLSESQRIDRSWLRPYMYGFEGSDAIRHIFRVAASLDSMVIGEPQILGQLKSAFNTAKAAGAVSGMLETVLTRAFTVAKRVRTETEIGASAVSVSYAAVELAREIFGSLSHRRVMLIGAGKMSEHAARHLKRAGVADVYVTNRTRSRAEALASLFGGRIVDYATFHTDLPEMDIVITSSGTTGYVLTKSAMKKIIGARRNRPMFLIDIAVPRNIEPSVNELDNIFLYDIDDLQKVVDANLQGRIDEAVEADKIVTEEVERLEGYMRARTAGPLIMELEEQLETLRRAELQRGRGKLGPLTSQQEEALEALTKAMMNKVAHGPISELRKHAGTPHGAHTIDFIRRVFRLRG